MQLQLTVDAEEWRAVVGYEGLYEVSSYGRVRRSAETARLSDGRSRRSAGKLLGIFPMRNGYMQCYLYRDGSVRGMLVHRLVATAFLGEPPSIVSQTNHRDGQKANNRRSNLEWNSPSENTRHAFATGLFVPNIARGVRRRNAKLTDASVRAIRASTENVSQMARRYGVSRQTIQGVLSGRYWAHVT